MNNNKDYKIENSLPVNIDQIRCDAFEAGLPAASAAKCPATGGAVSSREYFDLLAVVKCAKNMLEVLEDPDVFISKMDVTAKNLKEALEELD